MSITLSNPFVPRIENESVQSSFILDLLPALVFYIDKDLCFRYINQAFEARTGIKKEFAIGKQVKEVADADIIERLKEYINKALSGINTDFETDLPFNGTMQSFEVSFKPDINETGNVKGFVAFIKQLAEKKGSSISTSHDEVKDSKLMAEALEKKVELRTKELQIANHQLLRYNEELEQFAYAASHDLQEPLRKIQTFAGMLAERNFDELNDAGKNYLSKIIKSIERMSGIIEDLLYYSRQTRMDELFEEMDLNIIVENVLSDLELMIQQKGAQVEFGILPYMKLIPSQINRLFYNLISNSLKFSNAGVPPKISISVKNHFLGDDESRPAFIELLVQDNGIGFEQKYADRIFQLFQRLNDKHSYNGNGIGLALCKKIVQNHNGDIYAEAKPNSGATFHIRFPASMLVEEKAASIC